MSNRDDDDEGDDDKERDLENDDGVGSSFAGRPNGSLSSVGELPYSQSKDDDLKWLLVSGILKGGVDCDRVEGGATGGGASLVKRLFAGVGVVWGNAALLGSCSTSFRTLLIALKSKPACKGRCEDDEEGS